MDTEDTLGEEMIPDREAVSVENAAIVDGHEVSLHFAEEPNVQIALKIKQALLGTLLTEKE